MKRMVKVLSVIMAIALLITALAGCGSSNSSTPAKESGNSQSEQSTNNSAAENTPKDKGSVEFLLTYPKEKVVLYEVLDEFQAKTGIKLNIQYMPLQDSKKQINIMVAGNSLPDVIDIDAIDTAAYASMGILADITDRVKAEIEIGKYYEAPMQFSQYDGKYYALPFTTNNVALYYNKDMFGEAGLSTPPKNWDELFVYTEKLSKPGVIGLAMSGNKSSDTSFQFSPLMWQAGSGFDKLDSPETAKALSIYKNLIDKKQMSVEMANWSAGDSANQFIAGRAAMMVDGPWRLGAVKNGAKFNWDVAPLPEGPAGKATVLGGHNVVVVKNNNVDNAWEFVKYLNEPAVMQRYSEAENYIPARKDVTEGSKYFKEGPIKVFAEVAQFAKPRGPLVNWPKVDIVLQEMVQSVIVGQKTPDQAAKDAGAAAASLLK